MINEEREIDVVQYGERFQEEDRLLDFSLTQIERACLFYLDDLYQGDALTKVKHLGECLQALDFQIG